MTIEEAYLRMQDECGFKIGDKVKVLRAAEDHELGWELGWMEEMDEIVGKEKTITDIRNVEGILLDDDYWFPWFVLELIEKKPQTVELTVKEISERLGYEVKIVKED